MGPLEIVIGFTATWIMVALFFTLGYMAGRFAAKIEVPPPAKKMAGRSTLQPQAAQAAIPGVDVKQERQAIVQRAKKEFGLSDVEAGKFADNIIKQASPLLGRLHSQG